MVIGFEASRISVTFSFSDSSFPTQQKLSYGIDCDAITVLGFVIGFSNVILDFAIDKSV